MNAVPFIADNMLPSTTFMASCCHESAVLYPPFFSQLDELILRETNSAKSKNAQNIQLKSVVWQRV